MLGMCSLMVSMTLSPKASRFASSQVPSASLYGAYCTKHDSTCLPGGATDGSVKLGITMSMYGRLEKCPYLASSYARSMYSIPGEIDIAPRRCAPTPGSDRKFGKPLSARFTFPDDPRNLYRRTLSRKSDGSSFASMNFSNVRCGSTLEETTLQKISSPDFNATPAARPFLTIILSTGASVRTSAPASFAAPAIANEIPPVPPRL